MKANEGGRGREGWVSEESPEKRKQARRGTEGEARTNQADPRPELVDKDATEEGQNDVGQGVDGVQERVHGLERKLTRAGERKRKA